jgi:hypothetical protein
MRPLLLVMLVGACGAKALEPTIANHQRASRLICTDAEVQRLTALLKERWDVPALSLRCEAGQFRAAGYFVEAQLAGLRRTGIVDPSGTELVPFRDEPATEPFTFITGYRAADLDGDGEDEIIESWRRIPSQSLPDNWLVIRLVSGNRLVRIKGPHISRYHPELGGCSGSWQLRPRAGVLTIDVRVYVLPGIPPTDCLPAGKHRFSLRGRSLTHALRP